MYAFVSEPLAPNLVAFLLYFLIATLASAVSITVFIILVVLQRYFFFVNSFQFMNCKDRKWNSFFSLQKTERMGHVSSLSCPQQSLRGVTGTVGLPDKLDYITMVLFTPGIKIMMKWK